MRPPPQLRHAGCALLEERPQQTPGDGQADAFGLSRGGETGEPVGIEDDSLLQMLVEAVTLGAEVVVFLGKVLKLLAVIGAVHSLNDSGSVAVECLTRSAGERSLSGDRPVGADEDSGGVGDAQRRW